MAAGENYEPSNGTEGSYFIEKLCMNCIHEKFMHTQDHSHLKCDILSRSILHSSKESEYPKEWVYDENNKPTCTAFKFWDWGFGDDDGNGLNEPPPPEPYDPNQLMLPLGDVSDLFIIKTEVTE